MITDQRPNLHNGPVAVQSRRKRLTPLDLVKQRWGHGRVCETLEMLHVQTGRVARRSHPWHHDFEVGPWHRLIQLGLGLSPSRNLAKLPAVHAGIQSQPQKLVDHKDHEMRRMFLPDSDKLHALWIGNTPLLYARAHHATLRGNPSGIVRAMPQPLILVALVVHNADPAQNHPKLEDNAVVASICQDLVNVPGNINTASKHAGA
mmetsp:Transcript_100924/g.240520  ORF Transcript_100924/g.240520 Transcript_100924/m.240520 type:complete len:204 (+) Transcript_100924:78-689(+)